MEPTEEIIIETSLKHKCIKQKSYSYFTRQEKSTSIIRLRAPSQGFERHLVISFLWKCNRLLLLMCYAKGGLMNVVAELIVF